MKISWYSFGVSSFIACYLERHSTDKFIGIYVSDQHPDSLRFAKDCESKLGKEIEIIRSQKYASLSDLIMKTGCINTIYGAPCCNAFKKSVREAWEKENPGRHQYVWGYDCTEKRRAERLAESMPEHDHIFPLIKYGLTKEDCHGMLARMNLRRPRPYDLGFRNNNCIGCVKSGMGGWNLVRKRFPEVFYERAKQERLIGNSCLNGIFLDELNPERGEQETPVIPRTQITFLELMGE